ncbi:MAG: hypothetical protein D6815_12355, partial [Candidatus Dadabacteria bacterium]
TVSGKPVEDTFNRATPERAVRLITIPEGKTLSELTLAVYGRYDRELIRKVQSFNPWIKNPDAIYAGDTLLFPRLSQVVGNGTGNEASTGEER